MTRILKKKGLFFIGLLVTSIVSGISSFVHSNYSKDGSLLATVVYADIPPDTTTITNGDGCGGGGGAGCSDGCY